LRTVHADDIRAVERVLGRGKLPGSCREAAATTARPTRSHVQALGNERKRDEPRPARHGLGVAAAVAGSAPVVRYIKLATVAASSNAAWTTTFQVLGTVSRGQESHAFDATVVG
jgi:hypothetical protein